MPMTGPKFVLFDFDGVIADSFSMASAQFNRKCKHNTIDTYRTAFEGNVYDFVEGREKKVLQEDHGEGCDHDIDWFAEYEKGFIDVAPFQGIVAVLSECAKRYTLVIITSGSRSFI